MVFIILNFMFNVTDVSPILGDKFRFPVTDTNIYVGFPSSTKMFLKCLFKRTKNMSHPSTKYSSHIDIPVTPPSPQKNTLLAKKFMPTIITPGLTVK